VGDPVDRAEVTGAVGIIPARCAIFDRVRVLHPPRIERRTQIGEEAMTSLQRVSIAGAAVLVVGVASLASAQMPCVGGQGSPMYDVQAETTITGTVERVETMTGRCGCGHCLGGTHVVVATGTGTVAVHVGPTAYLTEQKITLAAGDSVEILGARVTAGNRPAFLARQIATGSARWTLRDESGRPLWIAGCSR
jgi:hypothetical protein